MYTLKRIDDIKKIIFENNKGLSFSFLENGAVFSIKHGDILVNQVLGNSIENSLNNIFLRIHKENKIIYAPMLGPDSESSVSYNDEVFIYEGKFSCLKYRCVFHLDKEENIWFWEITAKNVRNENIQVDFVYAQDIGIAHEGAVRNNESYTSQYIDHTAFDTDNGYVICCRQNQSQGDKNPWMMHGLLDGEADGYLTDGFQFFGLKYRENNVPAVLTEKEFPNENLQYEFAYSCLKSEMLPLAGGSEERIVFYALYESDHPDKTYIEDLEKINTVKEAYKNWSYEDSGLGYIERRKNVFNNIRLFQPDDLNEADIENFFPGPKRHVELQAGKLYSFFYDKGIYVSLKEKEVNIERPSGQILRSGTQIAPHPNQLSTTNYVYGLFNSQVTIGNTAFNKILTLSRNHLNVMKTSGQRVLVKTDDGYELLAMPSVFEIGINYCKWIYKNKKSTIIIRVWTSPDDPAVFLEIDSCGDEKEFLITNNIILGNQEYNSCGTVCIDENAVELIPSPDEDVKKMYPKTKFFIVSKDKDAIEKIDNERLLFSHDGDYSNFFVNIKTKPVSLFTLAITGNILSESKAEELKEKYSREICPFDNACAGIDRFWADLSNGFGCSLNAENEDVNKLNDLVYWYIHNAMVHYTVPRGLEQYNCAAWGTRDVCQGDFELLLSTRNYRYIRDILGAVFSHQYIQTGDWPQWFMFDRFKKIQAAESHGDVIVWPLKALTDYIEASGDIDFLSEKIGYTDVGTSEFTKDEYPLSHHVDKLINSIKGNFIPGTALSCYGNGDWNDTLQPAEPSMRKQMVSGWTVGLTYQVLKKLAIVYKKSGDEAKSIGIDDLCGKIRLDYNKYMVKDGVASGFVYFNDLEHVDYMLHPSDSRTGIKYRLLPMIRGMISGLFTRQQTADHYKIIKENLYFPDGVRLMDTPAPYNGGVKKLFRRAEEASNFGREIGLLYVHAHIRFIEAMAKIGKAGDLYEALGMIMPINISKRVSCAKIRQSNAYFTSSDAFFRDRDEAKAGFADIKQGKIQVRGGWRIYSSGPGIYINQVISSFFGLRESFGNIVIDPILPRKLDGLELDFRYGDKEVKYLLNVKEREFHPKSIVVNGKELKVLSYEDNPYRDGGAVISKQEFENSLNKKQNIVEVEL